MYEGLTRDILERAIPSSLDLHIVNGFIEGQEGELSPQIDAILVSGQGRQIPYTTDYVWPIQNVLAVFEVKKNLYGADLDDAFRKLRAVNDMHVAYMRQNPEAKFNLTPTYNAFARLTGRYPRSREEAGALPEEMSFIFHNTPDRCCASAENISTNHRQICPSPPTAHQFGLLDYGYTIQTETCSVNLDSRSVNS